MWQAMGSGGYSHGSPGAEPPLIHATRESSQAWGQVLGLMVPGFRGVSCGIAQQWVQVGAYLALPVLLLGLLDIYEVPFGQGKGL